MPAMVELFKGGYFYARSYAANIHALHKTLQYQQEETPVNK